MPRNSNVARLPTKWNSYSIYGSLIHGNVRLVFFKTPIGRRNLSPEDIVTHLNKNGIKLGLVIDLTDTDKYYKSNEFVARNVVHYKIRCCGMKVPDEDIVEHFKLVVSRFFEQHSNTKKYVGIHCLNGVNRTGYLVCRYLIDVLNFNAVKAINTFQEKRGHDIEHDCIRDKLLRCSPSIEKLEDKKKCAVM